MTFKRALLASAATLAGLTAVMPASAHNLYVTVFGGANWTGDVKPLSGGGGNVTSVLHTTVANHTTFFAGTTLHFPLDFFFNAPTTFQMSGAKAETGFVFGAAVGTNLDQLMTGLRGEVELSFHFNKLKDASVSGHASDTETDTAGPMLSGLPGDTVCTGPRVTGLPPLAPVSGCQSIAGLPAYHTFTFQGHFSTNFAIGPSDGSVSTWALMANVWKDFPIGHGINPYIGGGIGVAYSDVKAGAVFSGKDTNFAWQLGAGVNFDLSEKTSLGLGYRYMDAGDVTLSIPTLTGDVRTDHSVTHQAVTLDLTFKLN